MKISINIFLHYFRWKSGSKTVELKRNVFKKPSWKNSRWLHCPAIRTPSTPIPCRATLAQGRLTLWRRYWGDEVPCRLWVYCPNNLRPHRRPIWGGRPVHTCPNVNGEVWLVLKSPKTQKYSFVNFISVWLFYKGVYILCIVLIWHWLRETK